MHEEQSNQMNTDEKKMCSVCNGVNENDVPVCWMLGSLIHIDEIRT